MKKVIKYNKKNNGCGSELVNCDECKHDGDCLKQAIDLYSDYYSLEVHNRKYGG